MVCFEPVNAHIQYRGGGRDRERVNDSKHWDPLGVGNSIDLHNLRTQYFPRQAFLVPYCLTKIHAWGLGNS